MMMKSGKSVSLIGASVQGAAHIQQNKPCQDDLLLYHDADGGFAIACVADGHGSARCPFSDEGARAATQTATELLRAMLTEGGKPASSREMFDMFNSQKEIRIPKQLEAAWKSRVEKTHANAERERQREWGEGEDFPYLLYGTTLLALVVTDGFIFTAQIGDGDMLMVDPSGEAKRLMPEAYQTSGSGETFSLCMEESWKYVNTQIIPVPEGRPLMFLLSTDGYANSFTETAGFLKAGADIYGLWETEGEEYVKENITGWLTQSSEMGSGDDITLAVVRIG